MLSHADSTSKLIIQHHKQQSRARCWGSLSERGGGSPWWHGPPVQQPSMITYTRGMKFLMEFGSGSPKSRVRHDRVGAIGFCPVCCEEMIKLQGPGDYSSEWKTSFTSIPSPPPIHPSMMAQDPETA